MFNLTEIGGPVNIIPRFDSLLFTSPGFQQSLVTISSLRAVRFVK